jgi:hypothetical protein
MSTINKIKVNVITSNIENAGTDGDIFFAIAGREFKLDSSANDFQQNSNRTYILGKKTAGENGTAVLRPSENDPHTPFVLDTDDLDRFPVWIRFEPLNSSDWNVDSVLATVNPGQNEVRYHVLDGTGNLWLGQNSGKYCFLKKV